jgi:hypothetical protein
MDEVRVGWTAVEELGCVHAIRLEELLERTTGERPEPLGELAIRKHERAVFPMDNGEEAVRVSIRWWGPHDEVPPGARRKNALIVYGPITDVDMIEHRMHELLFADIRAIAAELGGAA